MGQSKIQLLVADKGGKIFEVPDLTATGMKAGQPFALSAVDLIKLPPTSELFALPDRLPVGYDAASGSFKKAEGCFAVAAFLPPY